MKFVFAAVVCCVFLQLAFSSPLPKKDHAKPYFEPIKIWEVYSKNRRPTCRGIGENCVRGRDDCCPRSLCVLSGPGDDISKCTQGCLNPGENCVVGECCRGSCETSYGSATATCPNED